MSVGFVPTTIVGAVQTPSGLARNVSTSKECFPERRNPLFSRHLVRVLRPDGGLVRGVGHSPHHWVRPKRQWVGFEPTKAYATG